MVQTKPVIDAGAPAERVALSDGAGSILVWPLGKKRAEIALQLKFPSRAAAGLLHSGGS